jgi:hypothetical protein
MIIDTPFASAAQTNTIISPDGALAASIIDNSKV